MRRTAGLVLVIAATLTLAACGGSAASHSAQLPAPLQKFIHSTVTTSTSGNSFDEVDVYGPGSRTALVKASSGDIVYESTKEETMRFYLVVAHGHFVCDECSGPPGHKPPRGTIETFVWSAQEKSTDFGIQNGLPAAVSHLHRLAEIKYS